MKTKGFAISFGDIMLPLIGVIAIGLVVVAGKLFLFTPNMAHPSVPIVVESPRPQERQAQGRNVERDAPASQLPAPAAQLVVASPPSAFDAPPVPERLPSQGLDVLAVPYGGLGASRLEAKKPATQAVPPSSPFTTTRQPKPQPALNAAAVRRTSSVANSTNSQPASSSANSTNSRPVSSSASTAASTAQKSNPGSAKWTIQVGAFSTLAAAKTFSEQVSKAGYKSTVVPSSAWHRVIVEAGTTRDEAQKLVEQINRSGFPEAFVVSPKP